MCIIYSIMLASTRYVLYVGNLHASVHVCMDWGNLVTNNCRALAGKDA